jgi:predicted RNA-binding Zn-ribbon protein involved in translation (DUF1610 family)
MPSGSGIIGGVKIEDALPGGTDVYLPVQNPYQTHYCPVCGSQVVTEEQVQRLESARKAANVVWPIWILMSIGAFIWLWVGIGDAGGGWDVGFIAGLIVGGFVLGLGWMFAGALR